MQFSIGIPSGDKGLAMPFDAHQASATRPQKFKKNKKTKQNKKQKKAKRKRSHSGKTSAAMMEPETAPTSGAQEVSETTTRETDESINSLSEDDVVCGRYRIMYEQSWTKCRHLVEKIKKSPQKHRLFCKGEAAGKPRPTVPAIELHPAVRPMSWSEKFFESARQFKDELTCKNGLGEIDPQFCIQYGPDHFRTQMAKVRRQNKEQAEKRAAAAAAAAEAAEKDENSEKHMENTKTEKNSAEVIAGPSCAGTSQGLEGSSSEDEAASSSDNEDFESEDEASEIEEESTEENAEDESIAEFSDGEIFGEDLAAYRTVQNSFLGAGNYNPICDSESEIEEEAISVLSSNSYSDVASNDDEEYSHSAENVAGQKQLVRSPLLAGNTGDYTHFSESAPISDDATPRTTTKIPERGFAGFFKDLKSAAKCFKWSLNDDSEESSDSDDSYSFEANATSSFLAINNSDGNFSANRRRVSSFLGGEDEVQAENDSATTRSAPVSSFTMVLRPRSKHPVSSYEEYKRRARYSF